MAMVRSVSGLDKRIGILQIRSEYCRQDVFTNCRVLDVSHDTDNRDVCFYLPASEPKVSTDGAVWIAKETPRHILVDHGDSLRFQAVLLIEFASGQQGHPHGREIMRTDRRPLHVHIFVFFYVIASNRDVLSDVVVRQLRIIGSCDGADSWQDPQAFEDSRADRFVLIGGISSKQWIQLERQQMIRGESNINCL